MHIGHNNHHVDYQLNGAVPQKTTQQKDLGNVVTRNFKWSVHVTKVAAKANSQLGIIKRNFLMLSRESLAAAVSLWFALYVLDYGAQS